MTILLPPLYNSPSHHIKYHGYGCGNRKETREKMSITMYNHKEKNILVIQIDKNAEGDPWLAKSQSVVKTN